MDLTPANIDALQTGFEVLYRDGFASVDPWHTRLCDLRRSSTKRKRYALPARLGSLREWLGDRQVQNLVRYTTDAVDRKYEGTVAVDVETVEDDEFDIYQADFRALGVEAADHPNVLAADVLRNGHAAPYVCYDGLPLWHAAHHQNAQRGAAGGTYATLLAGLPLTATGYETARASLRARRADNGRPMGLGRRLLLVVPPQLEPQAKRILQNEFVVAPGGAAPETNPNRGTAELLVVDELLDAPTTWYLFETGWLVRPLIHQERVAPQFVMRSAPTDPEVFNKDRIVFGVRARRVCIPTLPQLGLKCSP